ncbi:hypothetical protein GALMADRAFT_247459 [Galerina marginata CBS 339.88]|uniref:Uncharacterized protein n=1 Tax=Galerina marginata (strain CBS 339.88) TaxID=685588 RepID=A0A067SZ25_GALM3|nr:hypothetical protein GALMADRAFT_247459 [Galerina marginata CBS 339.88]
MAELDSLSDSDWLDIASGRDSDDNDSLSDQDSDRDEISSIPRSRRSSISNDDSLSSDVEAWEGFVSDSGDEALEAATGMYPVPLPSPLGTEPVVIGLDPSATHSVDPATAEEDQRVREALDQSFVGTLNASRSSTVGSGHSPSTHTSIRDLRLSFPDPLTSSRNELNRSYETVSSPTESTVSSSSDDDDVNDPEPSPSIVPPALITDPGLLSTTPEVQHHEVQHLESDEKKAELEIVLYGSSSEVKWKFVQELIQKAAATSGHVPGNSLRENEPIQSLRFIRDSGNILSFFNAVNVHDRTNDGVKYDMDNLDSPDRPSLAVVYLPAAKLPVLAWHDAYLPVLVPSVTDLDDPLTLQAAEEDWDLLAVPSNKVVKLGAAESPVFDPEDLVFVNASRAYDVLRGVGRDIKKSAALKPLTEQVKSVNAVTLFALMSIIMGFAFNTAFRPPTPAPTPTINTPSSSSGHLWGLFGPQPNRSILTPSANTKACGGAAGNAHKDVSLSIFNPGSTSLSVTPPPASKSLSIAGGSGSKDVAEASTTSPATKCKECGSTSSNLVAAEKPGPSTDVVVRSTTTSLSKVSYVMPSMSITASRSDSGSGSTIILGAAERPIPRSTVGTSASATATLSLNLNTVSEVFDATTKALAVAVGTDLAELAEAADELLTHLRQQTDNVIRQSKGKARAFGESIQNLNEEVVSRNNRAKKRAKELKEMGKEFVLGATTELRERTRKARTRARALKKSVVEGGSEARRAAQKAAQSMVEGGSEAWKTYEKAHSEWEGVLSRKGRRQGKKNKENGQGCFKGRRPLRMRRTLQVNDCL